VKPLLALTLLVCVGICAPLFAIDTVDPKLDRAVRDLMPVCPAAKIKYDDLSLKLPPRFTGVQVNVESDQCGGAYTAVLAPSGAFFLGNPWPIANEEGKTVEEKLKNFTWRNLHESMTATVDPTRNADGLFPVTLNQASENGKMPLTGFVDADARVFFFGSFRPTGPDMRATRAKAFAAFAANSPSKGAANPTVTIVEFSDFQCPSCMRAAGYVDPIVAKHGDKVRYIRYDLPLSGHAWAFPAALVGRAIHRQNPELFWEYKKQVYANQSSLNPFIFWDWARDFAKDHDLDLTRYDADIASAEIKTQILNGAGTAFSNDIRATPSYMVNGAVVDAGEGGKDLADYVEKLVTK
jgi:protein-disulfide isomerase